MICCRKKKCVCPSLPTSCKCREKSVSAKHDGSIPPDLQRLAATFLWLRRHKGRICFCAAPKYVCLQYLEYSGLQPSVFLSSRGPALGVWCSFCVACGRCGDRAPNGASALRSSQSTAIPCRPTSNMAVTQSLPIFLLLLSRLCCVQADAAKSCGTKQHAEPHQLLLRLFLLVLLVVTNAWRGVRCKRFKWPFFSSRRCPACEKPLRTRIQKAASLYTAE